MSRGILLYAHNSRDIDYMLISLICAGLAKKHLNLPVSIITDKSTIDWAKKTKHYKKYKEIFDKIIMIARPPTHNSRRLHDGTSATMVPFINTSRTLAWELTPYDETLLIDSDYFIFTDELNKYWDVEADVKISSAINDIYNLNRLGYHDRFVSDTGVTMYWATTVMFKKTAESKMFFELVDHIKDHYPVFSELYRFDAGQYRNDIAFSVAKHIMDGYQLDLTTALPPVFSAIDKDELVEVKEDGQLTFIIDTGMESSHFATTTKDIDIHVMNKQSIIRNARELLELI